jgi:hypothetical protein
MISDCEPLNGIVESGREGPPKQESGVTSAIKEV